MNDFELISDFKPTGDQPKAIHALIASIKKNNRFQTLLGVTGSGKTFTLACALARLKIPTLVISHNKTLAAQLYAEFKNLFPKNAVEYFVSYYDYYQPESYIPQTDTYIEKDASINERLDRLRLSATSSLMGRSDVIIVASVSCIYNLGSPQEYQNLTLAISESQQIEQETLIKHFLDLGYERNNFDFKRGTFRVKGDTLDIFPTYRQTAYKILFFTDVIEKIYEFEPISGKKITQINTVGLYPAKHFLIERSKIDAALVTIKQELEEHLAYLEKNGKIVECQRLRSRTLYDMEMLKEVGYCHGIENYSRHLSQRPPGSRPFCLLDYFPEGFITIIDESHVTIPQLRGMYNGDKARKETLVRHGFRLPSCLDNRPLRFEEFMKRINQVIFVSATPSDFEKKLSRENIIEQIIRPTGLPDPEIQVRTTANQIDDLIHEIAQRTKRHERTIITTLTKRMAEELSEYLKKEGIRVQYLHSEIDTIERSKILKDLRLKKIDCIVGINLLREGIDLPEVSLVAILDADREGFLRSATSLIQVAGRCARNINGHVIMYADTITESMRTAMRESARRRQLQLAFNKKHNIKPQSIKKKLREGIEIYFKEQENIKNRLDFDENELELMEAIVYLENEMKIAAKNLQFEKAAAIRDKLKNLQTVLKKASQKKT